MSKQNWLITAAASALLLGATPTVLAERTAPAETNIEQAQVRVTTKLIREETPTYKIDMEVPVVSGQLDTQYQAK